MAAIGIDTHNATLAACAIDELGKPLAEATFANDPGGHVAFILGQVDGAGGDHRRRGLVVVRGPARAVGSGRGSRGS